MVVVPRRDRIDGDVAGIEHGPVQAVEQRPRAARDQHRLDRVVEAEVPAVIALRRFAQRDHTVGRRVIGLACGQRLPHAVGELARRAKLLRREVADGQIADALPAAIIARTSGAMRNISEPFMPKARLATRAAARNRCRGPVL